MTSRTTTGRTAGRMTTYDPMPEAIRAGAMTIMDSGDRRADSEAVIRAALPMLAAALDEAMNDATARGGAIFPAGLLRDWAKS